MDVSATWGLRMSPKPAVIDQREPGNWWIGQNHCKPAPTLQRSTCARVCTFRCHAVFHNVCRESFASIRMQACWIRCPLLRPVLTHNAFWWISGKKRQGKDVSNLQGVCYIGQAQKLQGQKHHCISWIKKSLKTGLKGVFLVIWRFVHFYYAWRLALENFAT